MTLPDPSQGTPEPEKCPESPPAAQETAREAALWKRASTCIICGQDWCDCGKGPEHG